MLNVQNLSYAYDEEPVLHDIHLSVEQGEILCLLGPSGCGKTTLLRIIAGLETTYAGQVMVDGQNMAGIPVHQRDFGLMFQDFALFPHMTVMQNVAFGLRMQGIPPAEQKLHAEKFLKLVGLSGFARRDIGQLSGGERQRVALARSLAPEPNMLMLDEPLGSLDAALREQLVLDLRRIIKQVGLTAVYVTHDQQEAYAIADRIAIMNRGHIVQISAPRQLYQQPQTAFVARFLGLDNIFPRQKIAPYLESPPDSDMLLLHPDGIQVVDAAQDHSIPAVVLSSVFRGDHFRIAAKLAKDVRLSFRIPSRMPPPHLQQTVHLVIDLHHIIGLHPD